MLVFAAVVVQVVPGLPVPVEGTVERVVTIALVLILFDGGMHIGWDRFRPAAGSIAIVGLAGTFLTAAGGAVVLHAVFGLPWYLAVLVATAVSPTDPAVVFSVLSGREIAGRSGTILEGESGANDPVGIALLISVIGATGAGASAALTGLGEFALQMGVGLAVGLAGGIGLRWVVRRVPLSSEQAYPILVVAAGTGIY